MKYNFETISMERVRSSLVKRRNTSLYSDYLDKPYFDIKEVFGNPTTSSDSILGEKTRLEWEIIVELDSGDTVGIDIYDYKHGARGIDVRDIDDWHIACESDEVNPIEIINQIMKDHYRGLQHDYDGLEKPSFQTAMEKGKYSDQLLAMQIATGNSDITDFEISEDNQEIPTVFYTDKSGKQTNIPYIDNASAEESFEKNQTKNSEDPKSHGLIDYDINYPNTRGYI